MDLPQEVTEFIFAAAVLRDATLGINPLTLDRCVSETKAFRTIAIDAELGLVVLDDANDSNPFCLITRGLAAGMVVHFRHDPQPILRFSSLAAFLEALRSIHQRRLDISELPQNPLDALANQSALVDYLRQLFSRDDESATTLVDLHFALLDPSQTTVIGEAAHHEDFLVRETAARFLLDHSNDACREIAAQLAKDRYPQVAGPARKALSAIQRRLYARNTP